MINCLFIDPTACTGCRSCETVCSLQNSQECSPYKSRIRIIRDPENGVNIPVTCIHCEKPVCKSICPTKAITRDENTGIVKIDNETCIGCKLCVYVCPIGAPNYVAEEGITFKCNLCDGDPVCVKFCTRNAIRYVPASEADIERKRIGAKKIMEFQTQMFGASTHGE